ncbi:MAG: class I SAM-dependent methyltransferase, partial [Firmicutes bacterium]|nr:class I SAM-dependent methyltransferase [Bacillota bacterium]
MKVYKNLAPYYDRFMDHINYEQEAEHLYRFLFQINKMNGRLLDIGAGSGGHMLPLLAMGIKTDGLDYSEGMIDVLNRKIEKQHHSAHLYAADMRDFTTEHRYDVIYCLGETIHHLEGIEDFKAFLRCADAALKDNGYLIFSWQEAEYFDELADCGDFYETHGDDYLLWSCELADDEDAAYVNYTAFVQGEEEEQYHRIRETHRLAVYDHEDIINAVLDAGFRFRDDLEDI